jgi:hypothetical protein
MTVSIIHALLRWILGVLAPGTGERRAGVHPAGPAPARKPEAPRTAVAQLPAHRSPYGRDLPLDGHAAALVRPYVIEVERERDLKSRRRVALVLAADFGIDLDPHVLGAEELAR